MNRVEISDVSRLLDGDLDRAATGKVVDALDTSEAGRDARDRFTLYALIGDVVRGNPTPDDGFSQRLFERMRREGITPQS